MSGVKIEQILIEPGIIKLLIPENAILDLEDVEEIRRGNLKLSEGESFCVLLDTRPGYFTTSPDAMKLLASEEYQKTRKASAIIVHSLAARIVGNFFKSLHRNGSPTRLFNKEKEALLWLRKF
jgi:hypothetical protein